MRKCTSNAALPWSGRDEDEGEFISGLAIRTKVNRRKIDPEEKKPKQQENQDPLKLQENEVNNIVVIDESIKQKLGGNKLALQKYVIATKNILDSWYLLVPAHDSILNSQSKTQAEELIKRYLLQAEKYGGLTLQRQEVDPKKCIECGGQMEEKSDYNGLVCDCGHVENIIICNDIPPTGNSNNTENSAISVRNLNDRVEHINELMNVLEGVEKYVIKREDIVTIESRMNIDKIKKEDLTRRQLLSIIQKEELVPLIGHLTKVYRHITGKKVMSIGSNLRQKVTSRHVEFYKCYHEYKSQSRPKETHIFKSWYLLWQYLIMENVDIDIPVDMPLMKLKETLDWHNRTMEVICKKLKENKTSRFDWKPKQLYVSN